MHGVVFAGALSIVALFCLIRLEQRCHPLGVGFCWMFSVYVLDTRVPPACLWLSHAVVHLFCDERMTLCMPVRVCVAYMYN